MPPLAVAAQGITERLLQWPEPRLVVTPLVEPLAEDRLTHLLGTRRAAAVDARIGQVFLAERAELIRRHRLQTRRVARIVKVRVIALEVEHHARHVRELLRALDLGM